MASCFSKKETLRTMISECGCQREKLRGLAEEIAAVFSEMPAADGESPLGIFISELVLAAADQRRRAERRQHQMECIADAKKRGVRFGAAPRPLPDNFNECYQMWRSGGISLGRAAESCGMSKASFRRAVLRREEGMADAPSA